MPGSLRETCCRRQAIVAVGCEALRHCKTSTLCGHDANVILGAHVEAAGTKKSGPCAKWQRECLQHISALGVFGKSNDLERTCISRKRKLQPLAQLARRIQGEPIAPLPHHVVVLESLAGVFSGLDLAGKFALYQRHGDDSMAAVLDVRHIDVDIDDRVRSLRLRGQFDHRSRATRIDRRNGGSRLTACAPFPEIAPLHDNLWREDECCMLTAHLFVLATGVFCAGETIGPPEPVPIVDVEGDRNGPRLVSDCEAREPVGRGRAAIAAFRGIELDQRDQVIGAPRVASRMRLRGNKGHSRRAGDNRKQCAHELLRDKWLPIPEAWSSADQSNLLSRMGAKAVLGFINSDHTLKLTVVDGHGKRLRWIAGSNVERRRDVVDRGESTWASSASSVPLSSASLSACSPGGFFPALFRWDSGSPPDWVSAAR